MNCKECFTLSTQMPCVKRPFKHCNPRSVEKKHYTNAQKTWALDFFAPYYELHTTRRQTRSPFKDAFRMLEPEFLKVWDESLAYRTFYDWHCNEKMVRFTQEKIKNNDQWEVRHEEQLVKRQEYQRKLRNAHQQKEILTLYGQEFPVKSLWEFCA